MKRRVMETRKVAKCDLCDCIKQIGFRYDVMSSPDNDEAIYASFELCFNCAQKLSDDLNMDKVEPEIELSRQVLF